MLQYQEIVKQTQYDPITTVFCPESKYGISWSIKAGIKAAKDAEFYTFFVADQPNMKRETIERFLSFMADESCELGCVRTEENLGNPVWFSKKYKRELLSLTKDQGGKKILKKHIENARFFKVSEKQKIIADLKKLEEKHITKEQFYLPDVIRQGRLLPAENESQIPAILFLGIAVIIFFWYHENEKYKEQRIQTLEQSMVEYPQIIEHLILFLGTGMSVVAALEAVATEYEKEQRRGNKKEIFVYEQIKKTCRQISFGVPQTKAFGEMGKKIGLSSYQKLSVLLVQSITRGSTDLFLRLKEEEEGAFFEKKEYAKRKGEQASTKLLAPMMVMLVVILVLLMFPALATFS